MGRELLDLRDERAVRPVGFGRGVMTGILSSVASFASMVVFVRSSATLMSLTVWNRPVW